MKIILNLIFISFLFINILSASEYPKAVITCEDTEVAEVYSDVPNGKVAFKIKNLQIVYILDQKLEYKKIQTERGAVGWIKSSCLANLKQDFKTEKELLFEKYDAEVKKRLAPHGSLALRGSYIASQLTGNNNSELFMNYGGGLELRINRSISSITYLGVSYNQLGTKLSITDNYTEELKLNYIEIPLGAMRYFQMGPLVMYGEVALSLSYLFDNDLDEDYYGDINQLDYGVALGFGFPNKYFSLGAKAYIGLGTPFSNSNFSEPSILYFSANLSINLINF